MVIVSPLLVPHPIQAQSQSEPSAPPNVLFLIVDDLNTWLLEDADRYSGRVVAPNIKGLAESGVNFVSAYTASPVCTPSRTAVLSGIAPWRSGIYNNGYPTDASLVIRDSISLPGLFRQAGYYTAGSGKVSHGYKIPKSDWDDFFNQFKDPKPPNVPLNGWAADKTGRVLTADWGPYHLPKEEINDWKFADFAIEQLQKEHTQPFFITCGIFRPHNPWYVPQEYLDLYPLDEIVIPEILESDLEDVAPKAQRLVQRMSFLPEIRERGLHKEGIQAYLAATTFADEQIGRVLDGLEASPYRDNTIVVLWSDHGWHLGEKLHWKKATLWEESTHSLLMIRVPGLTSAGQVSEQFVSLLDIYPTLTELAGVEPPEGQLDGTSLVPLLRNPAEPTPSRAISAFDSDISIRTERYRYIRYSTGFEEFYDCVRDPYEWTNQIDNPEYKEAIEELRKRVPSPSEMAPEAGKKKGRSQT